MAVRPNVTVVGLGPSGVTIASQIKKEKLPVNVNIIESCSGGNNLVSRFRRTKRNSPLSELLSPLTDVMNSGTLTLKQEKAAVKIFADAQEQHDLTLVPFDKAQKFLISVMERENNFRIIPHTEVNRIIQVTKPNGCLPKYVVAGGGIEINTHAAIFAQGASPKELEKPYDSVFCKSQTVKLESVLSEAYSSRRQMVVIGPGHSGAIAVTHILKAGGKADIFYRGEIEPNGTPFKQQYVVDLHEAGDKFNINRWRGVREPHYTELMKTLEANPGRYRFINVDSPAFRTDEGLQRLKHHYRGWKVVNATGFRTNEVRLVSWEGKGGVLARVAQKNMADEPPLLSYPVEGEATGGKVPLVYGLGIAYPGYCKAWAPDGKGQVTIEKENGHIIVGTNVALDNAKLIIKDLREKLQL